MLVEAGGAGELAWAARQHAVAHVRHDVEHVVSCRAGAGKTTRGGAFWDVEQFIWPNLMLLQPKMATAAMQYRYDRMEDRPGQCGGRRR